MPLGQIMTHKTHASANNLDNITNFLGYTKAKSNGGSTWSLCCCSRIFMPSLNHQSLSFW